MAAAPGTKTYQGGCHCGAVRYSVDLDLSEGKASRCNCSICLKEGYMSVQVPQQDDNFRLLKPDSAESPELGDYTFGTGLNHHRFCKNCGVHCFTKGMYVYEGKEVHHFSINAVTLDQGQDIDLRKFKITYWDGKEDNWTPGDEPFLGGVY